MMRNRPEFLEVQAGAGRLGAAAVSVSWRSTAAELVYLAKNCGARAIVFESDLWPAVEQAKKSLDIADRDYISVGGDIAGCDRYETDFLAGRGTELTVESGVEEDAAVVIYTSGTTGKPKGAVRKFPKDGMHAVMQFIGETPLRSDDVHLVTCPLYHSTAFGFLSFNAILGATAVLMDEFKPELFLQLVEKHAVTTSAGSLGGSAACLPSVSGHPAECAWADNDTFGVVLAPTLSATELAGELRAMRPLVEHRAK